MKEKKIISKHRRRSATTTPPPTYPSHPSPPPPPCLDPRFTHHCGPPAPTCCLTWVMGDSVMPQPDRLAQHGTFWNMGVPSTACCPPPTVPCWCLVHVWLRTAASRRVCHFVCCLRGTLSTYARPRRYRVGLLNARLLDGCATRLRLNVPSYRLLPFRPSWPALLYRRACALRRDIVARAPATMLRTRFKALPAPLGRRHTHCTHSHYVTHFTTHTLHTHTHAFTHMHTAVPAHTHIHLHCTHTHHTPTTHTHTLHAHHVPPTTLAKKPLVGAFGFYILVYTHTWFYVWFPF